MFYNWKYCSFYPNNFGASALGRSMCVPRSEYDDRQASLTRRFQRFVASTFYLKLCLEMYVGR